MLPPNTRDDTDGPSGSAERLASGDRSVDGKLTMSIAATDPASSHAATQGAALPFLRRVLEPPSYGWLRDGEPYRPTRREILGEVFRRIDIFADRRNWVAFAGWASTLALVPFLVVWCTQYFSWWGLGAGFLYSMVGMGTYGTIWLHRYSTHRAYKFSHPLWRLITRNLVIKILPEETYVVSHHVHHAHSDQAGDPYNARLGAMYCFFADTNHQPIARDLSEPDYQRVVRMLERTGLKPNTYAQYKKWGSVAHPARTAAHFLLNWGLWYSVFFLIGGHALACCLFGSAHIWAVGIRTFNYAGHGGGEDRRVAGYDFGHRNLSINQFWPGYVAGEWHNNHHLFPRGARAGFLPHQIDLPWYYIKLLVLLGGISEYKDFTRRFYDEHFYPAVERRLSAERGDADGPARRRRNPLGKSQRTPRFARGRHAAPHNPGGTGRREGRGPSLS